MLAPLALFAGLPDPMVEAIIIARDGGLLDTRNGGVALDAPRIDVRAELAVPSGVPLRLWVLGGREGGELSGTADEEAFGPVTTTGAVHSVELRPRAGGAAHVGEVVVRMHESSGIRAAWVVVRQTAVPASLQPHEPDAGAPSAREASP